MESSHARLIGRLQRLQRLTAALSRAVLVEDVVDVVVTTVVQELGAQSGLVALVHEDGERFVIARSVGFRQENIAQWSEFPLDAPLPMTDALRTGDMVVLESLADRDARYPALAGAGSNHEAYAIVPLMVSHGTSIGVIALGFDDAHAIDDVDRSFVQSVADQCAQAIQRARLYDEQRVQAAHNGFLAEASRRLASASGFASTTEEVVRLAADELASGAALLLAVPGGLSPVAVAHRNPAKDVSWREQAAQRMFSRSPLPARVLATGEALYIDDVQAATPPDQRTPDVADIASAALIPLHARKRPIGVLVLIDTDAPRQRSKTDRQLAESYCSLVSLNCDNARLLEDQMRIAQRLQQNLLPPVLPTIPGLEVGAAYHAAGDGNEVGGDFYDVFQVAPAHWVVVAGDVRGRGVDAAATTGLARHTIRAAAAGPRSTPAAIVQRLNAVLLNEDLSADEPRFCGVCVIGVEVDEGGATLSVCCSGSPLPRLLRSDGSVIEIGVPGTVAGVIPDPELVQVDLRLGPGEALVVFTDGIPDQHVGGTFFEDRIADVLRERTDAPAQELVDHLRASAIAFVGGQPDDDMAIVALRLLRAPVLGDGCAERTDGLAHPR